MGVSKGNPKKEVEETRRKSTTEKYTENLATEKRDNTNLPRSHIELEDELPLQQAAGLCALFVCGLLARDCEKVIHNMRYERGEKKGQDAQTKGSPDSSSISNATFASRMRKER
jgi:hypothetical protein